MSVLAPNFTAIPNVILDKWMAKLSVYEFKIIMAICRKTFGWHKDSDHISRSQLMQATGLCKNTIIKYCENLEKLGYIKSNERKNGKIHETTLYSINISRPEYPFKSEDEEGRVYHDTVDPIPPHGRGGGSPYEPGGGSPYEPTKETLTKEKIEVTKVTSCSETCKARSKQKKSDFFFNPISSSFEGIQDSDFTAWKEAYPHVDPIREIRQAEQWLLSNPSKSKKKLWRKFITGWFSKANDKAENRKAYSSSQPQRAFDPNDRRTQDIHGNPVKSPADGRF